MRVGFKPEPLEPWHKLSHMGFELTEPYDLMFHWNYTGTMWDKRQWPPGMKVINKDCLCTRKDYIDKVFTKVYGYSSRAQGVWAVAKPNHTNGFKDCKLVLNEPHEGCFMQTPFIDCDNFTQKTTTYRVIIMDYRPVITVKQTRVVTLNNLTGDVVNSELVGCPDPKIVDFCRAYPLEYGELDCCFFDRFYIYDVNPTPGHGQRYIPEDFKIRYYNEYKHHIYKWLISQL